MPPIPAERSLSGDGRLAWPACDGGLLGPGIEPHGLVDEVISALEARATGPDLDVTGEGNVIKAPFLVS